MASGLIRPFMLLTTCLGMMGISIAQPPEVSRIITVSDGLPQSFVSGICQDSNGFLWIATLNGFARYDGREFTYYRHTSADIAGLSENIILHLFDAGNDELLLCYMNGKMDILNTITGKVTHGWKNISFDTIRSETSFFKSLVRNSRRIAWMMDNDGGIYRIDLSRNTVSHLSMSDLGLREPVIGIGVQNDDLQLFTCTQLLICDDADRIVSKIPYPFNAIHLFKTPRRGIYSPGIRSNGDLLFTDADGIKIWNPATRFFKSIPLHRSLPPGKLIAHFDHSSTYFFEYNSGISQLQPNNTLIKWSPADSGVKSLPTSMYIDRSGVLWVGTNGYGLKQYNLSQTGLHGYRNQSTFIADVLSHYQVSAAQVANTFLSSSIPFANHCATFRDSLWISDMYKRRVDPQLALFTGHAIGVKTFRNKDASAKREVHGINFLTFTRTGDLWGIDQRDQLLKFNIHGGTFRLFPRIDLDPTEEINGMAPEGDTAFYISTNKSLVRFNLSKGTTEKLTPLLPSKDLLTISNDPDDKEILWIGTLSDGLIRYNKIANTTESFSMTTGLPNNTIYSILPWNGNLLWCSSNKGIFAFNKNSQSVTSFTSRDGLIDDEFNRYYYMILPDSVLAFGGPLGYTLFNPSKLQTDGFDPQIALTKLNVINMPGTGPSDPRYPLLPGIPINMITELHLRYDQNFITAEFAAMQFDFPEKCHYRYMLTGFDKNWVMTGNDDRVSYTNLPPGRYVLLLNASNTNGKWSRFIRSIDITISSPFWKTWWFTVSVVLVVILVFYLFFEIRLRGIKKVHAQKLQFERKENELRAMALRARMNPHFIFNCLNSIKALIQERQDAKAIHYLTTFVTLIRMQLNNAGNEIALEDELETCKLYLQLEEMRFDGRIAFEFQVEEDEMLGQTRIPPLILQPIIENAIVHGLLPAEKGGLVHIKIYREREYILCEIRDNGIGRTAATAYRQKSSRLHQSKGVHLLEERISMHNRLHEWSGSLQTIDLFHPDGRPSGTLVIVKFNADL